MSEENTQEETQVNEEIENTPSELEQLQARAKLMNIKFHHKAGVDKLKTLIAEAMKPPEQEDELPKEVVTTGKTVAAPVVVNPRMVKRKAAMKLVRIRVTCMNPNKSEHDGEIFTVGNALVGTIKKFVPFNADNGWHVPQIILNMIQERRCTIMKTVKVNGRKQRKGHLIKEFAVEIMDPLSAGELKTLAAKQLARADVE